MSMKHFGFIWRMILVVMYLYMLHCQSFSDGCLSGLFNNWLDEVFYPFGAASVVWDGYIIGWAIRRIMVRVASDMEITNTNTIFQNCLYWGSVSFLEQLPSVMWLKLQSWLSQNMDSQNIFISIIRVWTSSDNFIILKRKPFNEPD